MPGSRWMKVEPESGETMPRHETISIRNGESSLEQQNSILFMLVCLSMKNLIGIYCPSSLSFLISPFSTLLCAFFSARTKHKKNIKMNSKLDGCRTYSCSALFFQAARALIGIVRFFFTGASLWNRYCSPINVSIALSKQSRCPYITWAETW